MFLTRRRVELTTSVLDLPMLSPLSIKVFKGNGGDAINSHECYAAYTTLNLPPSL